MTPVMATRWYALKQHNKVHTLYTRYIAIIILRITPQRHPVARPWGRAMGCLWEFELRPRSLVSPFMFEIWPTFSSVFFCWATCMLPPISCYILQRYIESPKCIILGMYFALSTATRPVAVCRSTPDNWQETKPPHTTFCPGEKQQCVINSNYKRLTPFVGHTSLPGVAVSKAQFVYSYLREKAAFYKIYLSDPLNLIHIDNCDQRLTAATHNRCFSVSPKRSLR